MLSSCNGWYTFLVLKVRYIIYVRKKYIYTFIRKPQKDNGQYTFFMDFGILYVLKKMYRHNVIGTIGSVADGYYDDDYFNCKDNSKENYTQYNIFISFVYPKNVCREFYVVSFNVLLSNIPFSLTSYMVSVNPSKSCGAHYCGIYFTAFCLLLKLKTKMWFNY